MSRRPKGELAADDLTEIEEGKIGKKCRACHAPQVMLVRLAGMHLDNTNEVTFKTALTNQVGVCSNSDCFRYVDLKKVTTWVVKGTVPVPERYPVGRKVQAPSMVK